MNKARAVEIDTKLKALMNKFAEENNLQIEIKQFKYSSSGWADIKMSLSSKTTTSDGSVEVVSKESNELDAIMRSGRLNGKLGAITSENYKTSTFRIGRHSFKIVGYCRRKYARPFILKGTDGQIFVSNEMLLATAVKVA